MTLKDLMKNKSLISGRKKIVQKKERAKRKSSGNSADDVLLNEAERMFSYVADDFKKLIVSVRTAYIFGIKKIGSKNDYAGILKKNLIPETTDYARRKASQEFFKLNHNKNIVDFWSKNRYQRLISYERNGKIISYYRGYDMRSGKIVKIPKRFRK